jgi:hypothetical protein
MKSYLRAVVVSALILFVALLGGQALGLQHAAAADLAGEDIVQKCAQINTNKPKLVGIFVPWYEYLRIEADPVTNECGVKDFTLLPGNGESSDIPLVLVAIVDDMLRLTGLIAVIFVIYGGIRYATSQGEPDATAKAQSTILSALIGMAIALIAVALVTFFGKALTK